MNRHRIRAAVRRWITRRRFARILRAHGHIPTRQLVNMALDYEGDDGANVVIREGWLP